MAPPFIADIQHWPTPAAFVAHLAQHDPAICAWAEGVTLHHTESPLPSQWRGRASVEACLRFYRDTRKWDRGPHLFLCVGAPNPADDGVWQLSPINVASTHAGRCNTTHWGVEVVGKYDHAPWSHALADLVYGVTVALLRWRGLPPDAVNGHRDCGSEKTCPGSAISLPAVRAEVARRFRAVAPAPSPALAPISPDAPILALPRCSLVQAQRAWAARGRRGEYEVSEVAAILSWYWEACVPVGVDPCLAVAQMAHETGHLTSFWSQRPQRNPAGIGVNGASLEHKPANHNGYVFNPQRNLWELGLSFKGWLTDSIPAHVGRLAAWTVAPGRETAAQWELIRKALAYRPLAMVYRGSARTLKQLGKAHNPSGQGWASPGVDYGERIAVVMSAMRNS